MSELSKEMKAELLKEVEALEASLTGNLMTDMDIKDKIHNIRMKINGVKPVDSHYDCVGCGS
ncbi:MAG: hypothetical protein CME63_07410 [Halobacteriovoraceae bacterium]|nr:hypothetical protein [Halobacteriovoraceae bacterium]MBC97561.1 hypothetical protein [Halobacteriovoraceae bacterium]|tara:strand:- start:18393 stop:18578 length:186 start_codon:yes stop_codon:yes gene_type:complete